MLVRSILYLTLFSIGVAFPLCLSVATVPERVLAEKQVKKKKNKKKKPPKANNGSSKLNSGSAGRHRDSGRRGYITYRTCPHSCRSNGLSKSDCKDWKEGSNCYVEDLTRPAGGPVNIGAPEVQPPEVHYPDFPEPVDPSYGTIGDREACLKSPWRYKSEPYIDIHRVRPSGGFFDSKYRVYGSIEGVCLSEAGYFESGRKRSDIRVSTSRSFRRFDFDVQVDKNDRPEIRVYTVHGKRAVVDVDLDYYRGRSGRDLLSGR